MRERERQRDRETKDRLVGWFVGWVGWLVLKGGGYIEDIAKTRICWTGVDCGGEQGHDVDTPLSFSTVL